MLHVVFPERSLQYIVVLFLLFIVQFIVACVCLAIGPSQQKSLFQMGWHEADDRLRGRVQQMFNCCGAFREDQSADNSTELSHPPCNETAVCLLHILACYYQADHFL